MLLAPSERDRLSLCRHRSNAVKEFGDGVIEDFADRGNVQHTRLASVLFPTTIGRQGHVGGRRKGLLSESSRKTPSAEPLPYRFTSFIRSW